jgi:hypothetical protein
MLSPVASSLPAKSIRPELRLGARSTQMPITSTRRTGCELSVKHPAARTRPQRTPHSQSLQRVFLRAHERTKNDDGEGEARRTGQVRDRSQQREMRRQKSHRREEHRVHPPLKRVRPLSRSTFPFLRCRARVRHPSSATHAGDRRRWNTRDGRCRRHA